MRFVYQILYRAATIYQQELRLIDRRRQALEANLSGQLEDKDLMDLHRLESTLVYFATSSAGQQHRHGPADPLQTAGAVPPMTGSCWTM